MMQIKNFFSWKFQKNKKRRVNLHRYIYFSTHTVGSKGYKVQGIKNKNKIKIGARKRQDEHSVLERIWIKGSYLSQWLPQGERGPPKESKSRWIEIFHGGSQFT